MVFFYIKEGKLTSRRAKKIPPAVGQPPGSWAHLPKSRLIDQRASGIPDEDNPGGSPLLTTHTKVKIINSSQHGNI